MVMTTRDIILPLRRRYKNVCVLYIYIHNIYIYIYILYNKYRNVLVDIFICIYKFIESKRYNSGGLAWGLRFCISQRLPGEVTPTCPVVML